MADIKPTRLSRVRVFQGATPSTGLELWVAEFDGHPPLEIRLEIPARTNKMKNAEKRDEAIQKLAMVKVEAHIKAQEAIYL